MDNSYWVRIDPKDLLAVANLLRPYDLFTPTFAAKVDLYDPAIYLREAEEHATTTKLLVDRNLLTRWISLVHGVPVTSDHRIAAGVLAFAQCTNMVVDPTLAIYELADRQGSDSARKELFTFRVADETHPGYWAEIALGRKNRIEALPERVPLGENDLSVNFSTPLKRWRRNYILSLKVAALELEEGSAFSRMSRFLDWMYNDFLMGHAALGLAVHYFAPGAIRRRLLKGLRSPKREVAIAGVRNAAWDLTHLSQWVDEIRRQEQEFQISLLASRDLGIHRLARTIGDAENLAGSVAERTHLTFTRLWGEALGGKLSRKYLEYVGTADRSTRQIHKPVDSNFISQCIEEGEALIRGWSPASSKA